MKRVLFVLAVVIALALPAMSVGAAGPVAPDQSGASLNQPAATAGSTGYTLTAGGTGTAELTSERSHPSPYNKGSVKLATVSGDDRGMVRFEYAPGTLKLDDLTTLSYWENVAARENPLDVFIDIWLDFNGDGVADASDYPGYMQAEPLYTVGAAPLNTWTQINAMTLKWSTYVGPDDPYNAPTITDFQANTVPGWTNNVDFGQLDILRVDVHVGYGGTWANFTGYADDIQINDYLEKFPLPSSNETNKTKGWGHVNQTAVGVGSTTLEFVSTRGFQSCFEYRTDGDTSQRLRDANGVLRPNYNLDITDGLYPFVCVNNSTTSRTIAAREYVEVRLTFGAEGSERFDWTRFNVPSTVTAGDASWVFYDDEAPGGIGEFVAGPGTAPLGTGSVRLALPGTVGARQAYGTKAYAGTRLDAITKLNYFTYRSSSDAGNNLAIAIQFDMDYDLTDASVAWQGRLVFEPYMKTSGTVLEDVWQSWDALEGKWWASGAPGNTLAPRAMLVPGVRSGQTGLMQGSAPPWVTSGSRPGVPLMALTEMLTSSRSGSMVSIPSTILSRRS